MFCDSSVIRRSKQWNLRGSKSRRRKHDTTGAMPPACFATCGRHLKHGESEDTIMFLKCCVLKQIGHLRLHIVGDGPLRDSILNFNSLTFEHNIENNNDSIFVSFYFKSDSNIYRYILDPFPSLN